MPRHETAASPKCRSPSGTNVEAAARRPAAPACVAPMDDASASRNNIEVSAARQAIEPKMLIEREHPAQTAGLGDSDKRGVR